MTDDFGGRDAKGNATVDEHMYNVVTFTAESNKINKPLVPEALVGLVVKIESLATVVASLTTAWAGAKETHALVSPLRRLHVGDVLRAIMPTRRMVTHPAFILS